MTSRIIKITPRQSGAYTPTKNLVDFDIPSGQYDLSRSYVNLNVSVPSQSQGNISLVSLQRNNDDILVDNTAFVRNVSLKSQTKGVIENNRHINLLRANQKIYEESVSKALSSEIISKTGTMVDVNGIGGSPYRQISKLGGTYSKDIDHDHIIKLKDIMNFCKHDYYDTDDKGDLMLHIELNLEGFQSFQQLKFDDPLWTQRYGKDNTAPINASMKDLTSAQTVSVLNTKRTFPNINESPFYIGQALSVNATGLTGAPQTITITDISKNTNDNSLAISTSAPMVFSGATTTDITVNSLSETTPSTPVFNSCELVLVQTDKQASVDYEYTTYSLQEDSVNTGSLNKNYFLSGMCKNVFVCSPQQKGVLESNTDIVSYRTSVNNVYQQNRLVLNGQARDPLHLTQIMRTYDNSDTPLKNCSGMVYEINSLPNDVHGNNNVYTYMVAVPVEITSQPKLFGLEMNTVSGQQLTQLYIFEEVIKQF